MGAGVAPDFNPRTREGCDNFQGYADSATEFISIHAPVKGATSAQPALSWYLPDFNPRTREGCDEYRVQLAGLGVCISIHAPVKGATGFRIVVGIDGRAISIHAPVKGATLKRSNW